MSQIPLHRSLESTVGSLRSIFGIVMGLTLANSIERYVTGGPVSSPIEGSDIWEPTLALFILFFLTVVQFFHGNHRILDEILSPSARALDIADPRKRSRYSDLWFEYLFMMTHAALFGVASFYIHDPLELMLIVTMTLVLDLLLFARKISWFVRDAAPAIREYFGSLRRHDERFGDVRERHSGLFGIRAVPGGLGWFRGRNRWGHDTRWFILNSFALGLLAIPLTIGRSSIEDFGWGFWTAFGILIGRGVLDYAANWRHYFPVGPTSMKVFLGAPFSEYQTGRGTPLDPSIRTPLSAIIDGLRRRGHEVYSAHEREGWGSRVVPGEEQALRDYAGMVEYDVLLAFHTDKPSGGLYVELGWALGLRKPVLLLAPTSGGHVNLKAAENVTRVLKYHSLDAVPLIADEIEEALADTIESAAARPRFLLSSPNIPDVYIHSRDSFDDIQRLLANSPFSTYATSRLFRQGEKPWLGESFGVLSQSELVIIELSDDFSGEGEMDLGFGLAIQKPIILLHSSSRSVTPMITGLGSLYSKAVNPVSGMAPALEIISFDSHEDKLAQLSQALGRFAQIMEGEPAVADRTDEG